MNIEIDADAVEWIRNKGNEITVKIMEVQACCAPDVQEIVAVPGKPNELYKFNEISLNHISVFVQKHIEKKEKVILKLSGFGPFKSISVNVL